MWSQRSNLSERLPSIDEDISSGAVVLGNPEPKSHGRGVPPASTTADDTRRERCRKASGVQSRRGAGSVYNTMVFLYNNIPDYTIARLGSAFTFPHSRANSSLASLR